MKWKWGPPLLALALLSCDASNPVAPPLPDPGGSETTYSITITPSAPSIEAGDAEGLVLAVSVVEKARDGPPGEGTEVVFTTDLGHFFDGEEEVKLLREALLRGAVEVTFFPGAEAGTAKILVTVGDTVAQLQVEIAEAQTPPEPLKAGFTSKPSGLKVIFTDTTTGAPTSWSWNFGDASCEPQPDCNTSTEQNPFHEYPREDSYVVALTASDGSSSSTFRDFVELGEPPEPGPGLAADFEADPGAGEGLTVLFRDLSTGEPTAWEWSFGDGGTSVEQNPSHSYAIAGEYPVKLTVSAAGESDSVSKFVNVGGELADLAADFEATITDGSLVVLFTDASTGTFDEWEWDFGDGEILCCGEADPTHTYAVEGDYAVTLEIRNSAAGVSDSSSKLIQLDSGDDPPLADFTWNEEPGLVVDFIDKSSTGAAAPDKWFWDFADGGATDDVPSPTHTFSGPGSYRVKLTVSNGAGDDTRARTVTVGAVDADFTHRQSGCSIIFTDRSSGAPDVFRWEFGDGMTSSERSPTHDYTKGDGSCPFGDFDVELTVERSKSPSTDSVTKTVTLFPF